MKKLATKKRPTQTRQPWTLERLEAIERAAKEAGKSVSDYIATANVPGAKSYYSAKKRLRAADRAMTTIATVAPTEKQMVLVMGSPQQIRDFMAEAMR